MAEVGKPGDVLGGRYRLVAPLGAGGMARVWLAEHVSAHTPLAVKIIDPEITSVEFNLARFLREAKTLKSLDSPHLVTVLDYGADADTAYLVMELLTGETLGRRLAQRGRLGLAEVKGILHDVCLAMSVVHARDLIHRDLKPDNIFLCSTELRVAAKVVDFGIAKPVHEAAQSFRTHTGYVLGTPNYMSPEQCRGLRDVDHRSDLWSLGVIAYECLVGREPFRAETMTELLLQICMDQPPVPSRECAVALPDGFDAWFAKAVARDREDRFQSADELAAAFAALQDPSIRREPLARRASDAPTRQPELRRLVARKMEGERSTPFGLGVGVRGKLEPRLKWGAAAALGFLLALGAWQLLEIALTPRARNRGIEALQPSTAAAGVSSAAPSRGRHDGPTPAAEHDLSARAAPSPAKALDPAPAPASEPQARPLAPLTTSSTPAAAAPSTPPESWRQAAPRAPAPPAAQSQPQRRAPARDIRTSR